MSDETVPVAEQRAARVAPEDTVTVAEQKKGAELPAEVAAAADEITPMASASNESPVLPASAQAAAAKAHALLEHVKTMASQLQADIERVVPASMVNAAKAEVDALIRAAL